ncbi:metallophosphoesterase [Thermococcus sp.]|uniref:metallophosphoesterase family protein n=1 Tax=Thermococcus sp. TaxID=35749 RepID=UPI00262E1BAA|nr:metallophosphoesterase [Thermococcus sp.]
MKRVALALILAVVVLAAGCVSSGGRMGTSSTAPTSATTTPASSGGIDFSAYGKGQVLENWAKFVNTSVVYVSKGYGDIARHYFPNARILPASEYKGGVAILSPADARPLLRGKPIVITVRDYFGYIVYRMGFEFVGADKGVMAAFNRDGKAYVVFTGLSKAGAGAAVDYAMKLRGGAKVPAGDVVRRGQFEGVVLKVIGDNDWNGLPEKGEHWTVEPFSTVEPFIYYWRVVDGENVTVRGGFIRLVNGSTVHIHALGFNVSIRVENSNGAKLTYVLENINPKLMVLPEGAKVLDNTTVEFTTNESSFSIVAKNVSNYTVLAFGDHRPASGTKPPEVFLKIMKDINDEKGAFVIDGGDLVYTGTVEQWAALLKVWKWNKPIFIAAGNHEYQGDGISIFHRLFGPTDYVFSLGGYRYIFANDVMNNYRLSDEQFAWIQRQLEMARERGERPVIVMHAPPYDPRPGGDDHAMNEQSAQRLLKLMKAYNAFGIFSHIHLYWNGTYEGVHFIITGGGGAPLYAPPNEGGFHHFVILTMGPDGRIGIKVVKVSP